MPPSALQLPADPQPDPPRDRHPGPQGLTPSQTVGPYLAIGLPWPDGPWVVDEDAEGAITISGQVVDGAGSPVPDALVETWQAAPDGSFAHPDDPRGGGDPEFRGFGRCPTDAAGRYQIITLRPGGLPAPAAGARAPRRPATGPPRGGRARCRPRPGAPRRRIWTYRFSAGACSTGW